MPIRYDWFAVPSGELKLGRKTHTGDTFAISLPLILLITITGCLGDAALPVVSSTPIPGTELSIELGGPDPKGHYHYYVNLPDGTFTHRPLGPVQPDESAPATVEELGDGVFRIQWGDSQNAPYTVIDAKRSLIVEDSNQANNRNQSFNK